ncbi:putative Xaa-Pro aminopeptidase P [Holospora obtusa F1]|uniref:Xaa-Pro aminopeptidase P n=1 Tax=Holospora obtusa F1 TaxID=1399147 RepID=W6TV67_HOLOB|nr:M24 family metallopeptidase [Holospora obtusa]ETZ07672.1 putative Xaa-Pro aminopeptidase P [Holospora obtusa F1]
MLSALRKKIRELGADSALVFHNDQFLETQRTSDHIIFQIVGFTGSYATLWVGLEDLCMFTDDRYMVQGIKECNNRASVHSLCSLHHYVQKNSKVLLIDPWQVSKKHSANFSMEFSACKILFKPFLSFTYAKEQIVMNLPFFGRSECVWKENFKNPILICNTQDLSFLSRVATKNSFLPTLQAYAVGIWEEAYSKIFWYVGTDSLIKEQDVLPASITILPLCLWKDAIQKKFSKIYYIPEHTPLGLLEWFPKARPISSWSVPKKRCIKTNEELEAMRQVHVTEGIAFTRFLYWIEINAVNEYCKEYDAVLKLEAFRKQFSCYQGPSFPTISASGASGAMIHYVPKPYDQMHIQDGPYLIDAGGQYYWGTTDMTRSLWLGNKIPDPVYQEDFTQVLKGHIDVAMSQFPVGTLGSALDVIARRSLWQGHKDYGHSTGHGVGIFSNVHEGPVQLSSKTTVPLEPGMVCSNEPGYYRNGLWGIRLENLFYVKENHCGWLCLDILSLAPFQRCLIQPKILGKKRVLWINHYHQHVLSTLGPYLSKDEYSWLKTQTDPINI